MDFDWEQLKLEYASSDTSYRALCSKYGIPLTLLKREAKRSNWVEERALFKTKVTTSAIDKMAEDKSRYLVSLIKASDKLASHVSAIVDDVNNLYIDTPNGNTKVDTKAIRDLSATIKDLTSVIRNLRDIPTIQEETAMEIAREKLEIDRKRAQEADSDDLSIGIVMMPEVVEEEDE